MTAAEALRLAATMARWWPAAATQLAAADVAAGYREALADVGIEHALAAADAWRRDGADWPPTAGQLRAKLAALAADVPDWWQVKAALTGYAPVPDGAPQVPDYCLDGVCDGSGFVVDEPSNTASPCSCRSRRRAIRLARRAQHPLIAAFLAAVGHREVADLAEDRTAEAQVRRKWEEFVAGALRQITYRGIAAAGLPGIERASSRARSVLGRFDPLAALDAGRPSSDAAPEPLSGAGGGVRLPSAPLSAARPSRGGRSPDFDNC